MPTPPRDGTQLRFVTYNIHGSRGTDGRRDVARIVQVLGELNADIVGLQEVEARSSRSAVDQFAHLAEALGMHAVAGPLKGDGSGHRGNLLLTRLPVLAERRHDLSVRRREPRGAIDVDLDRGDGRTLRVVTTHLGLRAVERRRQTDALLEAVNGAPAPTLLLGDFNEWHPFSPRLRDLYRRFGHAGGRASFPAWLPVLHLDRILASQGIVVHRAGVHRSPLARVASDHLPVWAELRLPAA